MPELPEMELYLHALTPRILHEPVKGVRVPSPSLLRTFDPPVSAMVGLRVLGLERLGKRVVWVLEEDLFAVFHLMISGRFKWREAFGRSRSLQVVTRGLASAPFQEFLEHFGEASHNQPRRS